MYLVYIHFPSGQHTAHESALIFPNFIQQALFNNLSEWQIFSLLAFQSVCLNYTWYKAVPRLIYLQFSIVPGISIARRWTLNKQKMLFC